MDQERNGENYFFGSGDFGLNPIRTESPQAGGLFQKKSAFSFDDSAPSTPLFSSSNSPHKYDASGPSFDSFSRFDSFRTHDTGLFATRDPVARFDSMRSSRDFDQGHGFPSFDDSDPFGSGPFRTSLDSQTPRKSSDNWSKSSDNWSAF